jgi:hypothetical protein
MWNMIESFITVAYVFLVLAAISAVWLMHACGVCFDAIFQ